MNLVMACFGLLPSNLLFPSVPVDRMLRNDISRADLLTRYTLNRDGFRHTNYLSILVELISQQSDINYTVAN